MYSEREYPVLSEGRYKVSLFTIALFNYTDFKTTLLCIPCVFLAPYIVYSNKYFTKVFDPKTGA